MSKAQPTLSSLVAQYLDEGAELMSKLSEEEGMNEAAGLALVNWLGRFQVEVEDLLPYRPTDSDIFH
jgi:hypothetical protein